MYTKILFIIFLLLSSIYATDSNRTIDTQEALSIDHNATSLESHNNSEVNTSIIQKANIKKYQNFNMSKGNSQQGKKIFNTRLKKSCQTSSYKFVNHYSQDEWEEIAESGSFRETIFKLCQNIRPFYQDSWSPDLYQFAYEHANDN
jgi:hypothetical protein